MLNVNLIQDGYKRKLKEIKMVQNSEVLTVKQIREKLNIGLRQAYSLVNKSDFPSIRVGGSIRIPKKAFEEWLENQAQSEYSHPNRYNY